MTRQELFPEILNVNKLLGRGVEIGVFKGEFSKHLLNNWAGKLYMIDPWRGLDGSYDDISNHNNHENPWLETQKNIEGFENRAFMLRGLSDQLVDLFPDNSLDFVFIDGNHAYEYVKEDIRLWYPKVKKGGVFSGHDYIPIDWKIPPFAENGIDKHIWSGPQGTETSEYTYTGVFGVNPAVDEFCRSYGYNVSVTSEYFGTWYVIK